MILPVRETDSFASGGGSGFGQFSARNGGRRGGFLCAVAGETLHAAGTGRPESHSMNQLAPWITLAVGLAIGFIFDRLRLGAAYKNRDQVLSEAKREADNIAKQADLDAKEA